MPSCANAEVDNDNFMLRAFGATCQQYAGLGACTMTNAEFWFASGLRAVCPLSCGTFDTQRRKLEDGKPVRKLEDLLSKQPSFTLSGSKA